MLSEFLIMTMEGGGMECSEHWDSNTTQIPPFFPVVVYIPFHELNACQKIVDPLAQVGKVSEGN